jgi:polyisoprenoid-binding protein YceI
LFALLAACAGIEPPTSPSPATAPAVREAGYDWYQRARAEGKQVYQIDTARSLITVTVRRGGVLARLGHDHVIAIRDLSGFAAPEAGRADLAFRLDRMSVDEPELRRLAGFDTQPPPDAVTGTRNNMLGPKVLDAARFPLVQLQVRQHGAGMRLAITLHGVTRSYALPATLDNGTGTLTASGKLQLLQTDFGIAPMSVLGGALVVLDPLELQFRIVASAAAP